MVTGFASQKVPAGKLLQIEVSCEGTTIQNVKMTGDFFLHPEEAVTDLEKVFEGHSAQEDPKRLTEMVESLVKEKEMQLVGVTPQDIVATLIQAAVTCTP